MKPGEGARIPVVSAATRAASLTLIVIVVGTALFFDYTNGFHDTANAMATTIATRALPPRVAVALASILNFAGAFISVSVAATIASGIVEQNLVTVPIVFAGLVGAILWNLVTWYFSIPSSSSHALIGGVLGAMIAAVGTGAVIWSGIVAKVIIPALLAPFICGGVAYLATRLSYGLTSSVSEEHSSRGFRLGQIASSSLVALAHGTNDAQKTMGVITLTLVAGNRLGADEAIPLLGQGHLRRGHRRRHVLGRLARDQDARHARDRHPGGTGLLGRDRRLVDDPRILLLRLLALDDAGRLRRHHGRRARQGGGVVHWKVVRNMVIAWILTLPAAGLMGALAHEGVQVFPSDTSGVFAIGVVALAIAGSLFYLARRTDHVTAKNVIEPRAPGAPVALGAPA